LREEAFGRRSFLGGGKHSADFGDDFAVVLGEGEALLGGVERGLGLSMRLSIA